MRRNIGRFLPFLRSFCSCSVWILLYASYVIELARIVRARLTRDGPLSLELSVYQSQTFIYISTTP